MRMFNDVAHGQFAHWNGDEPAVYVAVDKQLQRQHRHVASTRTRVHAVGEKPA